MTNFADFKLATQSRFLIIGYGDEFGGDRSVGLQVANAIENWHLPAIKTIATRQLRPELAEDLVAADYAIFVDACSAENCSRTVQLDPVAVGSRIPRTLLAEKHNCIPLTLLNLTQQLYGRTPQAWLLQVPTESFNERGTLSSTAQRGLDRSVRIVAQLLKTYQQPGWISSAIERPAEQPVLCKVS
ncbi:MAG: hydrogenase maturation protease [Phormidesmis sp.]